MSGVAIMKTKAEQGLENAFEGVAAELPGGEQVLTERKTALKKFSELGLPHRRIEEWKYTDLRAALKDALPLTIGDGAREISADNVKIALGPLANIDAHLVTFVDGAYRPDLSSIKNADGLTVSSLAQHLASAQENDSALTNTNAEIDKGADAVLALNTAFATDGYIIKIAPSAKIDKPVLIFHLRASKKSGWTATRGALQVGDNADATVIEAFVCASSAATQGQTNTANKIEVGAGAKLSHIKCVIDTDGVTHLANWIVTLEHDSTFKGFQFTQGPGLVRNQVHATFNGQDARLNLSGAFLARSTEHIDNTMVVDHKVPDCESRELFKGVLDDRARGIVQGKVIVRPDAQKTDGHQMAKALMLSPDTEFDSKPELEIYADDVVCGHGSTVDQIDDDLLFYCRSRGIPENTARALLVQSFVGEALEVIENDAISHALSDIVGAWLQNRESNR